MSKNDTENKNPQAKVEEQKEQKEQSIMKAIKNIPNNQSLFTNPSSSDMRQKKLNPKDSLEEQLEEQFQIYKKYLEEIYPGNKLTKDAYCKIISLVQNSSHYYT